MSVYCRTMFQLSVVLAVYLPTFVLGEVTLSFNSSYSNKTGFFTDRGETIKLSCSVPEGARDVTILKGKDGNASIVVENGEVVSSRYKLLTIFHNRYDVIINNISYVDSSLYRCKCTVRNWSVWNILNGFSEEQIDEAVLHVNEPSNVDESELQLVSGTPSPNHAMQGSISGQPKVLVLILITSLTSIALTSLLVFLLFHLRRSSLHHDKKGSTESIVPRKKGGMLKHSLCFKTAPASDAHEYAYSIVEI